jgi:hypothetical protein
MRIFWFCVAFAFTLNFKSCESSKILVVFPSPSRSQILIMEVLTKELAESGHQVTMVSPFPLKKPVKNYRDVKVSVEDNMQGIINLIQQLSKGSVHKIRMQFRPFPLSNFWALTLKFFLRTTWVRRLCFIVPLVGVIWDNFFDLKSRS